MFQPRYTITNQLLANIKRINTLIGELNNRRFSSVVLIALEKSARSLSTHASTSIEGNPLPLTEVKKILKSKPEHIRDSEREVLNYNQALITLQKQQGKQFSLLSFEYILHIQKQVTSGLLPAFESGSLRQKPVVVNNPKTHQVAFLPPDVQDVKPLMLELVQYIHQNKGHIDPLIIAGIFHKQMVIIHPFMDGNGRTTRLATKILLAQMGLNTFNLFSFENYYNQNVSRYFQTVGEYGDYYELKNKIDFTVWLEYFTEGIIDELLRVQKLLAEAGIDPRTELQEHDRKLLKHMKEQGFITDKRYAALVTRAKATRTKDFKRLLSLGYIKRKGKGKATYYILKDESSLQ
ncbi:MAG: Fic family protein [Patescibacteria group bacterium]